MSSVSVCRQSWRAKRENTICFTKDLPEVAQTVMGFPAPSWQRRLAYWILWFIVALGIPSFIIVLAVHTYEAEELNHSHQEFANVSCNLNPSLDYFVLFFTSIFTFLFCQLVCAAVSTRLRCGSSATRPIVVRQLHVSARYGITAKLAVTHSFVWMAAFIAVFYTSVALWHVFALFSCLQAIYITVNCIFTRPVLNILNRWHEDKPEELKGEQTASFDQTHLASKKLATADR
ncbi:unnamed protein product [Dicrocoelium dendriticum]|nr:unnamed protein product [Dicrocoelium dendriticum]